MSAVPWSLRTACFCIRAISFAYACDNVSTKEPKFEIATPSSEGLESKRVNTLFKPKFHVVFRICKLHMDGRLRLFPAGKNRRAIRDQINANK
jgi:hypothetical protein